MNIEKKIFFSYNYENPNNKEIIELSNVSKHFIGIGFFDTEILNENKEPIGYVVYNYFIQEIKENKFAVMYKATFFVEEKGTISWEFSIIQDSPNCFYSLENLVNARITTCTGIYGDSTGKVYLYADKVGSVLITIIFDDNVSLKIVEKNEVPNKNEYSDSSSDLVKNKNSYFDSEDNNSEKIKPFQFQSKFNKFRFRSGNIPK